MQNIFKREKNSNTSTGNIEFQCLTITRKMKIITNHIIKNKKDFQTTKSLKNIVAKRRKLLNYLSRDKIRYKNLIIKAKQI